MSTFRLVALVLAVSGLGVNAQQKAQPQGAKFESGVQRETVEAVLLRENFDNTQAPALPAGWLASNAAGSAPLWRVTQSTIGAYSGPYTANIDNPATVSDKRLDSPAITITSPGAQLTFYHAYQLESSGSQFFDGGVLEISIGGAAFTDIVVAGGVFTAGGYNATISGCCGNPLAGRQAWSGYSPGGFVRTTVNLPPSVVGHTIRLRWRMGSDSFGAAPGWAIDNVELVTPPGSFEPGSNLTAARRDHTTTLLQNGRALVVGGSNSAGEVIDAEVYDPNTGSISSAGTLHTARSKHTATALPNGKVLVAGGAAGSTELSSAELFDPATGLWSDTGSMAFPRVNHTAVLLPSGKVLVAGGGVAVAELYNPADGTWSTTGALNTVRSFSTATLLRNGTVLVAGGYAGSNSVTTAEIFDPGTGIWTPTGDLQQARAQHTATMLPNGQVLTAGGANANSGGNSLSTAEVYDPISGTWTLTAPLNSARRAHSAVLLASGKVLVCGGNETEKQSELYDSTTQSWTITGDLLQNRAGHTATLLTSGKTLVVGGGSHAIELYNARNDSSPASNNLTAVRRGHTATLLPSGKVLIAGGATTSNSLATAELYDPSTGQSTVTGTMAAPRTLHTATLLPNGQVLVAGGFSAPNSGVIASTEIYQPAAGNWVSAGNLNFERGGHTATLLPDGRVFVAGGRSRFGSSMGIIELFDPATRTWRRMGSTGDREFHSAVLLPSGKVLIAGGAYPRNSFEIYDPIAGQSTQFGTFIYEYQAQTATLLPSGKVLLAGGLIGTIQTGISWNGAELFDPATSTSSVTGNLFLPPGGPATLLHDGSVLIAGGPAANRPQLYDPASGVWSWGGLRNVARSEHTATLLPSGEVLLAGGSINGASSQYAVVASTERYNPGLGFLRPNWQPDITTATHQLNHGAKLALTGARFRGISGASTGNTQDSSTPPIVQLRSLVNEQTVVLSVDASTGWSDSSFTSVPVDRFTNGPALVTIFANGVPSDSKYLNVGAPLLFTSASSRKVHGNAGPFDLPIPFTPQGGVECRSGGPNGQHTLVFAFSNDVISGGATILRGAATTSSAPRFVGKEMIVELASVSDAQTVVITLSNVTDAFGQVLPNTSVPVHFLLGDTVENGVITASDISFTKSASGQSTSSANFRADVNVSGTVNASDIGFVKSLTGRSLP